MKKNIIDKKRLIDAMEIEIQYKQEDVNYKLRLIQKIENGDSLIEEIINLKKRINELERNE